MDYPSVLMPGDLEAVVELKRFDASFRAKGLFDFEVAQLHFPRISPQIWRILDSVNCVVVVIARIERERAWPVVVSKLTLLRLAS
jgi:hypothetical protein